MKKIKKIILCILSLFLVLCLYQWYIQSKDTYRFKSVTYTQKTLPKEFNGFTIGYLSDLNLSTKEDLNRLKKAVKEFNQKELYTELRNYTDSKGNKPNITKSYLELEEMLAEDFRNYAKNQKPSPETPVKNTLFRKMLNFLKDK